MADWMFYSPTMRYATAGDLLRTIPSTRIWRLERSFVEEGRDTIEMVRAAELMLDLDVTLRLQNDPTGATRMRVAEATDADRQAFASLGHAPFPPSDVKIVAQISLTDSAVETGHLDITDDVVSGLELIYPGGMAHSPATGEFVAAREIARIMDTDEQRCSHLDLKLSCDPAQQAYVSRQLSELPPPFGRYLRVEGNTLYLRARFPTHLRPEEVDAVCNVALEMAEFARGGHVRFRENGVWRHAVAGIGAHVRSPPVDQAEGVFGRLTRMLGAKK